MKSFAQKHQKIAKVIWNKPESHADFRIGLTCSSVYENALPGQFVTLHLPGNMTPLLRRPFSIHRLIKENKHVIGIEILYKVVGGFTEKLTRAITGDPIDLLGPIGNGFTVSKKFKKIALVGGGIGIAPLVFLADAITENGVCLSDSIACLGGRTSDDILCKSVFKSFDLTIRTTTDDGSEGEQGLVTRPLEKWITSHRPDMVYACGPMPMLRAVADIANKNELPCEISIETIMACGLGACLGCAVNKNKTTGKYQHVCIDGPVFDAKTHIF
ncbi:MAG: dihydroorotate dehydrogenase electron transfer subunit [Desulfobacteraceae bacterium]|nr:dihydroorotate dehydrogenase electron transfer subunit [Desulfobacteraceae bacterium]MBC2754563.1 dihydroorotate dehydrogenase electron transfer subunit [Desulfobacteraceae bacterium]MBC2763772.1 dihydroorotate dehydrogenase electron transfer subunit [ANME-2 cluster archaeon]